MNNLELLKWQIDMGADEAIEPVAINQFAAKPKEAAKNLAIKKENAPATPLSANASLPPILTNPQNAAQLARELADKCNTLKELEEAVRNFEGCSLKKTATNTVFCDGNPEAKVMFIGEAPGADEDIKGIPFCGASGKLLDTMLKWIGLTREKNFYITNTIFWRPPGNRKPTPEETEICRPFVEKHIALINPQLLVLVGGTATTAILNDKTGITRLRGNYFEYTNGYMNRKVPVGVIFHPSYLLRSPGQKRFAWQDLLSIKHKIKELCGIM